MLLDFELFDKITVIKTVWYWHKNRHTEEWKRTKSPEINSGMYSQLIYDKGAKKIQWGKDSLFNKWYCENWIATCKRMNWTIILPYTQKLTQNGLKILNEDLKP